jgi:hypothetical protein
MSKDVTTQPVPKEVADAVQRAMAEAKERIENIHLPDHWRACIDHLDENFAFFLTHVLNMGAPEWDMSLPTAAVALPSRGASMDEFKFLFNPTFAALLEPEELAFVAAHECLHVLLNHLMLLDKGKQRGKFKDARKFNVAADCVINDYLSGMGLEPGRVRDYGMFGPQVVGYDCSNATVSEVYIDIPDDPEGEGEGEDGEGGGEGEGQGGQGGGDGLDEYMKGMGKGMGTGSHDWLHDPEQEQIDAAENISKGSGMPADLDDKKQDDQHKGTPGAGPGSEAGAMRNFVEQKGVSMKWAELLREVEPDFFKNHGPKKRPSYHRRPRKLAGVYERYSDMGVLPVTREPDMKDGKTPSIVMFMDGSGSCSDWIDNFATLAKSVPEKKLHLTAYSFSTYVVSFDPKSDKNKLASGGTMFSPIEDTIRKEIVPELGHYPTAVVVMTDLEGHFNTTIPEKDNQSKWLWLATHQGRYDCRGGNKFGKVIHIEEFCEGMPGIKAPSRGYR